MRIIFMGTPEFAVASLQALLEANLNVVAVVTSPDRPAGRGQKLKSSAVKIFAEESGLPVLQPEKLKDEVFLDKLRSFQADLQVVVAFRMLPEVVWNMPPKGTINLHASLLPQYRGAAPINHVLINGETETGITTFLLQQAIDTGHVLLSEKVSIEPEENAGQLHDKLMQKGAALLVRTIQAYAAGQLQPIPQQEMAPDAPLREAPKLFKEDGKIDWTQTTDQIFNRIRGMAPYPGAYTFLDSKLLKIFEARKIPVTPMPANPGAIQTDGRSFLRLAAADGWIELLSLQLEGKRRMQVDEFLRGNNLQNHA